MRYLLDTNILTRLSNRSDTEHAVVAQAIHALVQQGHTLCLVPQTIYEFWTVASRPAKLMISSASRSMSFTPKTFLKGGFLNVLTHQEW